MSYITNYLEEYRNGFIVAEEILTIKRLNSKEDIQKYGLMPTYEEYLMNQDDILSILANALVKGKVEKSVFAHCYAEYFTT